MCDYVYCTLEDKNSYVKIKYRNESAQNVQQRIGLYYLYGLRANAILFYYLGSRRLKLLVSKHSTTFNNWVNFLLFFVSFAMASWHQGEAVT